MIRALMRSKVFDLKRNSISEENKLLMEKKYPEWVEEEEKMIKNAMEMRKTKTSNDLTASEPIVAFRSLSID